MTQHTDLIFYSSPDGHVKIEVIYNDETFWMTQKRLAELFGVNVRTVNEHLQNIYSTYELEKASTIRNFRIVQKEGNRSVNRELDFYNLDAIIAVGYRVNSKQATQFRIWATQTLKEFIIKGFAMDDERLKQGRQFGKDYFDELLARIRDIRASEKRFYQKIRDLFSLSGDYDKTDKKTELFFAEVQNKLLFATTGNTAAELIMQRAKAEESNMGLTTWKGSRVRKEDVIIAKNYLTEDEIDTLNRMVTLFLDTAELRVKEQIPLSTDFWKQETDNVIQFSRKPLLLNNGKVSHEQAKDFAQEQYAHFDTERRKNEALAADLEDQKIIEELLRKAKR